jgi:dienelactone hydrolase
MKKICPVWSRVASTLWRLKFVVSLLAFAGTGLCQRPFEVTTKVDPLPGEDPAHACQYTLVIPDSRHPVRAAWIIFDRGLDFTQFFQSRQAKGFAAAQHLALVFAFHCRAKQIEDMNVEPAKGIGRALITALDQFALSASHAELRSTPLLAKGWSGAASLAGRLAAFEPNRFMAGILYEPGQCEPLGMDTIDLSWAAFLKPQLIIAGGSDDHVGTERPYRYFKRYFDQGAPWTFAIQNKTPHCCLQNAQNLILEWLNGVLNSRPDLQEAARFGYLNIERSPVVDGWRQHTFNAVNARVGSDRCQADDEEVCAGWLPGDAAARTWLAFVLRTEPVAVWEP